MNKIIFLLLLALPGLSLACEQYRQPKPHYPVSGVSPEEIKANMPEILALFEGTQIIYMNFWSPTCVDVLTGKMESATSRDGITIYLDKNDKGWSISGAHKWDS